jgi:hypothetical protein
MFNSATGDPQASAHIQAFFMQIWNVPSLFSLVIIISSVLVGGLVVLAVINFSNKD